MSKQNSSAGRDVFDLLSSALLSEPREGVIHAPAKQPSSRRAAAKVRKDTPVEMSAVFYTLAEATKNTPKARPVGGTQVTTLEYYLNKDPLLREAVEQYGRDYYDANAASRKMMRSIIRAHLVVLGAGDFEAQMLVETKPSNRKAAKNLIRSHHDALGGVCEPQLLIDYVPDAQPATKFSAQKDHHDHPNIRTVLRGEKYVLIRQAVRELKKEYGPADEVSKAVMIRDMRRKLYLTGADDARVEYLLGLIIQHVTPEQQEGVGRS